MATQMIADENSVQYKDAPKIEKHFDLKTLVSTPNIAEKLSADERNLFGDWVVNNYVLDDGTRKQWTERNAEAMKLALQVVEDKSFPWTNCSNIKFPLVTIAALQFLARISILTKGRRIVKVEYAGADPDGKKAQRCDRISTHMSVQLVDDDINWRDDDEKTKLTAAIVGSGFKSSLFDPVEGNNISEYIPTQNIVMDYFAKSIDTCNRVTRLINMSRNRIEENVVRGLFVEMENEDMSPGAPAMTNLMQIAADDRQGTRASVREDFAILKQSTWYDFDGDGYAEPYNFYVREDTGQCLRIVARYYDEGDVCRLRDLEQRDLEQQALTTTEMTEQGSLQRQIQAIVDDPANRITRIVPLKEYTQYTFIPAPDGGIYGLGLGALLGPLNETVNTIFNQLIDSGTMSTTAGGFLGRGVKLKGGKTSFDPFEWKPVDSTGDDLRKNIFPLPVREPSAVLFQLLGLLISYGEKIGSATDIMTGVSPGQNTPAETSRNTIEQGMMLFSGIYDRMYRSFRSELTKLYELNRLFLKKSPRFFELTKSEDAILASDDYTKSRHRIFPIADPSAVSGEQKKQKADKLVAFSQSPLGAMLDKKVITKQWLEDNDYSNIDQLFPQGDKAIQPPPNPEMELKKAELQQKQQQHQDEMTLKVAELKSTIALNQGKILELQAKASMEAAKADAADKEAIIGLINAQIGITKVQNEHLQHAVDSVLKAHEIGLEHGRESQKLQIARDQAKSEAAQPAADANNGAGSQ